MLILLACCAGGGGGTPGGPPGGGPGGGGGGGGGGKTPKDKDKGPSKSGKKVPSSFVEVIDTLVDLLLRYEGPYAQPKPKETAPGETLRCIFLHCM